MSAVYVKKLLATCLGNNPPTDWTSVKTFKTADGANSVSVFVNTTTHQAVIAFKGSDNLSNFQSDLTNSGYSEWEAIKPFAQSALAFLRDPNSGYGGYQVMTVGHSLGGGMAQTMALENNLSGYGINALPISQGAISQDIVANGGTLNGSLSSWRTAGNTFREINVSGDPATLYYSSLQGQVYLSTSPTTLQSPYAACETTGLGLSATPTPLVVVGTAMTAYCAYKAHSASTVVDLLSSQSGATSGDTAAVDAKLQANASAIEQAFTSTTLTNSGSDVVAQGSNGVNVSVGISATSAITDTYTISFGGQYQTYTVATGSGASLSQSNATITVLPSIQTAITGSGVTVIGNAGSNITIGGNGQYAGDSLLNTVNMTNGGTVSLLNNSRANVFNASSATASCTVNAATGVNFGAFGPSINAYASAGDAVWMGKNGIYNNAQLDTLYVSGALAAPVTISPDTNANVRSTNGTNLTVNANPNAYFGVSGTGTNAVNAQSGDAVWASGGAVVFAPNSVGTIIGSNDIVGAGIGDSLGINGGNNWINFGQSTHLQLMGAGANTDTLVGTGNITGYAVDHQAAGAYFDSGISALISGANNRIVTNPSDTLTITNTGNAPDAVTAALNNNINLGNSVHVHGDNDIIKTMSNALNTIIDIHGYPDSIYSDNGYVNFWGDTDAERMLEQQFDHVFGNSVVAWNIGSGGITLAAATTADSATSPVNSAGFPDRSEAILLNLDGGQVQTTSLAGSKSFFDIESTGHNVQTAWGTRGEGILIRDPDNRNVVTQGASLVKGYTALAMMDSNRDGKIDAQDDIWRELKVWVDKTGSGRLEPGTLYTMDRLGITSIGLNVTNVNQENNGNTILYDGIFSKNDGTTGHIATVDLAYDRDVIDRSPRWLSTETVVSSDTSTAQVNNLVQSMAAFGESNVGIDRIVASRAANDDHQYFGASSIRRLLA